MRTWKAFYTQEVGCRSFGRPPNSCSRMSVNGVGQGRLRFFRGESGEDLRTGPLSALGYAVDSKGVRVVVDGRVELSQTAFERLDRV